MADVFPMFSPVLVVASGLMPSGGAGGTGNPGTANALLMLARWTATA
jgi:hypothetical protein